MSNGDGFYLDFFVEYSCTPKFGLVFEEERPKCLAPVLTIPFFCRLIRFDEEGFPMGPIMIEQI